MDMKARKFPPPAPPEKGGFAVVDVVPFFPAALQAACGVVDFPEGRTIFDRKKGREYLYKLLRGEVSVQREAMGESVVVQLADRGDWLIEPHLCESRAATFAVCERASTLLAVPVRALRASFDSVPGFHWDWTREFAGQVARLQRRAERLSLFYSRKRIAHYLATESADGGGAIRLPFSQRVWARHLGLSSETLSRALAKMIDTGQLERTGADSYRLRRLD